MRLVQQAVDKKKPKKRPGRSPAFSAVTLRMTRSVGIDPGLLDDRTPPVDFSLEMFAQRFGRSTLCSTGSVPSSANRCLTLLSVSASCKSLSEFVDHCLWRTLWGIEGMPYRNLEAL